MPRNPSSVNRHAVTKITAKELGQFFRSPIAWLFLAGFLLVTLFVFFWVESFFSRNIADVRPLFEWMPLLLIFLSGALTMKMWSEERRSGTLEYVLTQPVPLWQFVVGKFFACWLLLGLALVLTLPLPISVAIIGQLDWGPVLSGYLAALLLGGAYLAMGLFVSSRCDNQIVSLLLTIALGGIFYLLGAGLVTNLFGQHTAEVLRGLGTGSRFESIARGVVDFRDLYYYASLIVGFIALNIFSLERGRWAGDGNRSRHNAWRWATGLLVLNALVANVWLMPVNALRWDTTRGNIYSISSATENYLEQLQEPLLIRGFFSQKTHPLLAPLVPQMQDLLREYEIAGGGRVQVDIVDPTENPELEDEANTVYGITPTPFQVSDRHQSALVNSYFDILIQYGDEIQVLSFRDLIEAKAENDTDIDVRLRNPEYDVTRAIKKVLYDYQAGGDEFATVQSPIKLTGYISGPKYLPEELVALRQAVIDQAEQFEQQAPGKFQFEMVDPQAHGEAEGRRITQEYGFAPMSSGLSDANRFYFYLMLAQGDQLMQVDLGNFSEATLEASLRSGIKRFAQGFTRTVALVVPEQLDERMSSHMGSSAPVRPRFNGLKQLLNEDMNVIEESLADGMVAPEADLLFLAAPEMASETELFAVDQFLMRGGTVIVSTAPFVARIESSSLSMQPYNPGLQQWLADKGIVLGDQLVMDRQNAAFPVPTMRHIQGMRFQEMRMVDYPYFVDVRSDGFNEDSPITGDLPQVTVPWAVPITLDESKQEGLQVMPLLHSSERSWLGGASNVMPSESDLRQGYVPGEDQSRRLLAVALQGEFKSHFVGKESPLLQTAPKPNEDGSQADGSQSDPSFMAGNVLNHSSETARLVVFSSNDMLRDQIVGMLGAVQGGAYLNSLQFGLNAVDWALEDEGLLSIRARSHFNRTLPPMDDGRQELWEYANYALALLGLGLLWLIFHFRNRAQRARYQALLAG